MIPAAFRARAADIMMSCGSDSREGGSTSDSSSDTTCGNRRSWRARFGRGRGRERRGSERGPRVTRAAWPPSPLPKPSRGSA
eukprot:7139694-Pyramimonas_sp.AAC.1